MQEFNSIILSDDLSTSEVLKLYINEFDNFELLKISSDFQEIIHYLENNQQKTILYADISNKPNEKIEFINQITAQFNNTKVIALSESPSVDLIIKIMRAGATEFIPIPIIKNEFFEATNKIIKQIKTPKKANKCKFISVFSNKGGIGKTSLATNLALEISKITKENVALIDMNFQMGDITTFLDLKPSFNISYMLENIDKINETFLLSTLERYKDSSLYILADPPYFKQAADIKPNQITKLFDTLKDTFSYVIIDAEASFGGKSIATLDYSDMILLISVANLPALRNTQRCLELFDKLGYEPEKTKIIINRYMENDEIKEADIEKVLSKSIYWKIPNNYFALMSAINKGLPLSTINPNTNIAQSYKNLAQYICDNIYKKNITEEFESILKE